jgi:hypothetical protein
LVHSREQKYTCKYDKTINLINDQPLIGTQKEFDCHTETIYVFRKYVSEKQKWKEFTNLKPGTDMTYKDRQYNEKDEYKLMKAIIAQRKSYNNEQENKRKKVKRNECQTCVRGYRGERR